MKMICKILLTIGLIFALSGTVQAVDKYNVTDSTLDDWGIVPFDWTKIPFSPTVKYTVQDYHGTGSKINGLPDGGEYYDIEAMYFDADNPGPNAYFAVITSYPETRDLAIDLDNDSIYEYGVVIHEGYSDNGDVYKNPAWQNPSYYYHPENGPYKIISDPSKIQGKAIVKQSTLKDKNGMEIKDGGFKNYIIEGKINRSYLGNPKENQLSNIHLTMYCGNDKIEIGGFKWPSEIPEFPALAFPVASIMGIVYIFNRKKSKGT